MHEDVQLVHELAFDLKQEKGMMSLSSMLPTGPCQFMAVFFLLLAKRVRIYLLVQRLILHGVLPQLMLAKFLDLGLVLISLELKCSTVVV